MDGSALSCECLLMNGQGLEDGSQVRSLQHCPLLRCYFRLECKISEIPRIASGFCARLDKIQVSFLLNPPTHFLTFKCFNAGYFPQSYLPLFTPALLGSGFLHLPFCRPVSPHISVGWLPLIKHSCRTLRKAPLLFRIVI